MTLVQNKEAEATIVTVQSRRNLMHFGDVFPREIPSKEAGIRYLQGVLGRFAAVEAVGYYVEEENEVYAGYRVTALETTSEEDWNQAFTIANNALRIMKLGLIEE